MGKLSKSIKKHIKKNKIEDLESEFIGNELFVQLNKIDEQDIYTDQCRKIIEDYEYDCKKTNAINIEKITKYYDKNFKNGIDECKKRVKNDIKELNEFLKQLQSMGRNLKKCLTGRIKYKYICIKFDNRNENHNHPIIKGIMYYKKLEEFLFELEDEISHEKEIREREIKNKREKRRIEEERRRIEEEKELDFLNQAKISVDNIIRQTRNDDRLSSEELDKKSY